MNKKLIRKMQTAAGGPLRIKFTPEQIALFESYVTRVPGMNNSGGNRYREEGVLALQHLEQETKRKEEEIKSRMEMRPTLKRKVTTAEKLQGKKDEYELTPQIVGMSGADPLFSFYVGGVGLNGIGALAKTGLWNIAKYAPTTQLGNWGRGYFVGNTFKNSFNGTVPTLTSQATSLLYQPTKLNESGLTSLKFFERKPSKITEAEKFGLNKHDRKTLSENEQLALLDLALYKRSGQYRQVFRVTPDWENFGWNLDKNNPTFMLLFAKDGKSMRGPWARVVLQTPTGKGVLAVNPERNMAGYTSRSFPVPEGMNWAPGEANMMIKGTNELKLILTAPKTDFFDGVGVESDIQQIGNSLPSTIDKNIMKDFWINSRKALRPGTYLSGDNGHAPKGSELIDAFKKKLLYKADIKERPISQQFITRTGLSPDSYSSIIRLGMRDGSLRWGEGFEKWNNSAVLNKYIFDSWLKMLKGEISIPEYEKIFNSWSLSIGGKPLLIFERNGNVHIIHPHPYIFSQKQGGKMNILEFLKKGSGIHIKEKNKGSFTRWCGGNVTEECIRKGKASSNPKIRKKATFADNARHFKHKKGGKAFVEGVNVLDSNPKMSKAASRRVKKADNGTKLNAFLKVGNFLNSDTGKAIGSTLMNGLSAGFQAKQMNNAISEYELASKARLKKLMNGSIKDYYSQALLTMNPNENLSLIVLDTRAHDLALLNALKLYNEAKDELDYQLVGLKLYANELTLGKFSNIFNGLGGIVSSFYNNRKPSDNGAPSTTTNFWDTPTIKNSQVTGDFWNNPTIANSIA